MGQAYFDITPELLARALHLPDGTRLYGAEWILHGDCARLYITSPDLPEKPEGEPVGGIAPIVEVNDDGTTEWHWNNGDNGI